MDKSKFSLLSNIKYPNDLRKLSINQLPEVCKELREDIIDEVAVNPGHFASSLGVVEITVGISGTVGGNQQVSAVKIWRVHRNELDLYRPLGQSADDRRCCLTDAG